MTIHINNTEYTKYTIKWMNSRAVCGRPGGYCRALAIAAARCSAVGLSAVQLTHRPSAAMASCVVGPMAANWKQRSSGDCQRH